MDKPFVRSAYNYDRGQRESAIVCETEVTRVQQHLKEEVDINTIVKRFGLTATLPTTFKPPMVGDFTGVTDFHTAMNAVRQAQESFDSMPVELRQRFNHDPQLLMHFLDDPKNEDEARKLGLLNPKPEVTRDVVKAVDELAAKLVPRETK